MSTKKLLLAVTGGMFLSLWATTAAFAYNIQNIQDVDLKNDFIVGPVKAELLLDPGQSTQRSVFVTNRYNQEMRFKIEIEDFTGSNDANLVFDLLGDEKGPYSLKDYLKPEVVNFKLQPGDRATIPITVDIPKDAVPGGLYGAVIISTEPVDSMTEANIDEISGGLKMKSRIASLFFVRVKGDVEENGYLKEFKTDKRFYAKGPINFTYLFENKGSVWLDPSGSIDINNLYGTKVDHIALDQYVAMPGSVRLKQYAWNKGFMLGRYKATINLSRGYGDIVDSKSIYFWVLPWKFVIGFIICLIVVLWIIRSVMHWFKTNFEKRKR